MTNEDIKEYSQACFALGVLQGAIMVLVTDKQTEVFLSGYVDTVFDRLLKMGMWED